MLDFLEKWGVEKGLQRLSIQCEVYDKRFLDRFSILPFARKDLFGQQFTNINGYFESMSECFDQYLPLYSCKTRIPPVFRICPAKTDLNTVKILSLPSFSKSICFTNHGHLTMPTYVDI